MDKLITYYPNGQRYIIEKRINGIRKGDVYVYNATGQEISIIKYSNLQVYYIEYRQNNKQHNLHGPASITWDNGQIYIISYWQNGILHNLYGPAYMEWYVNGSFAYISYWQNGLLHNLYGPAYMEWYRNGQNEHIKYRHFGGLIKEYWF